MPGFILGQVLGLAFTVWIYYKVYMGRNWARILLLVFSAVGALFSLSSTFRTAVAAAPQFAKGQMMLGVAVNIVILWLLFVSPGREWFRREPADPM